jgi:flavodoxin
LPIGVLFYYFSCNENKYYYLTLTTLKTEHSKLNKMKAAIIYNSKHGKTQKYAESINSYLKEKGVETSISSIDDYNKEEVENSDIVFLGCWTAGLFFFLQGPEKKWQNFAKELPSLKGKKVALFTTYILATGSMFSNMAKKIDADIINAEMRSKTGEICEADKLKIDSLLA